MQCRLKSGRFTEMRKDKACIDETQEDLITHISVARMLPPIAMMMIFSFAGI